MSVFFEIQANDVKRAISFYKNVFDWKFFKEEFGGEIEYHQIETGDARGGIMKRPAQTPLDGYGTNAFVCSFEVENFDKVELKILSDGGRIALAKFAVPGKCWQGYYIDTEGNTFGIFQIDEHAK